MKVYLLRHGQTEYNVDKRYQGTRDIPLSEKGRAALRRADIEPDTVYVSPLCRAVDTARVLFPAARLVPVHDLREMCFGIFEGRNYVEMERDPDYLAWVGDDCMGRCPGGESRAEFSDRTCAAFASLVDEALARRGNARRHGARRHPDGGDGAVRLPAPGLLHLVRGQRGRLYTGCGALADARPAGPCGRSVLCGGSVRWILCWPPCAAF